MSKTNQLLDSIINDFFENTGFGLENYRTVRKNCPANLYASKSNKAIKIQIAVPGYSKEDNIEVFVEESNGYRNNYLVINVPKKKITEDEVNYLLIDDKIRPIGKSKFLIPTNSDIEKISITLENGLLEIFIPVLNTAQDEKVKKLLIK